MPARSPNFSPFPFASLRRLTRREAAFESAIARWVAARPAGDRLARLVGGRARIRVVGRGPAAGAFDPHAAVAEVRAGGASIAVAAAAHPVRALAQRLLGGPAELDAPRPLTAAEQAIWALAVAAALEDAGIAAEVWPLEGAPAAGALAAGAPAAGAQAIELAVEIEGAGALTAVAYCPPDLAVRAPPPRELPAWSLALPIVVGRCALPRAAVRALSPRDIVTLEPRLELVLGLGALGLRAAPGALAAEVATGYVRREMALPDDAQVELTIQLGTTQLSLRRIAELAVGEIVPLGRPLAGPYEVHAAGRLVGHGELVDLDGEVGVRIVSLRSQSGEE